MVNNNNNTTRFYFHYYLELKTEGEGVSTKGLAGICMRVRTNPTTLANTVSTLEK